MKIIQENKIYEMKFVLLYKLVLSTGCCYLCKFKFFTNAITEKEQKKSVSSFKYPNIVLLYFAFFYTFLRIACILYIKFSIN